MPTLTQIRDAITAKLNTVTGIGEVHGFERYAKREADFVELFKSGDRIQGWVVRRISTRESSPALGRYVVDHRWQVRGYMSLDDASASELVFDALIEAIRDAFRADDTLGGVIASMIVDSQAGAQLQDSGPVMFGGVLCHSARLALTTRHYQ